MTFKPAFQMTLCAGVEDVLRVPGIEANKLSGVDSSVVKIDSHLWHSRYGNRRDVSRCGPIQDSHVNLCQIQSLLGIAICVGGLQGARIPAGEFASLRRQIAVRGKTS